jgi:hypothetical protein
MVVKRPKVNPFEGLHLCRCSSHANIAKQVGFGSAGLHGSRAFQRLTPSTSSTGNNLSKVIQVQVSDTTMFNAYSSACSKKFCPAVSPTLSLVLQ